MSRSRRPSSSPRRVRSLALAVSLATARAFAADAGPALVADGGDGGADWTSGDSLYLEVSLNGVDSGKIAHFDHRADGLYATPATLERLGLRIASADMATPVRVEGLAGVHADFDAERQRVAIVAPVDLLDADVVHLNAPSRTTTASKASPGALLNYDLYGSHADGAGSLDALAELRVFGLAGIASTSVQSQLAQDAAGHWTGRSVRLGSDWTFSFPERMLSLTFGDFQSGSLAWSRGAYLGGIRIARDFSQQPYRLTMPLPAFVGEAVAPSAVDLYVNGLKQYSGQVAPGRFQVTALPVVSGAGDAQVVLTDAFGRATTIDFPFYTTDQLLQRGLSDYSFELGFVRRGYGQRSFDYAGAPMASGTFRYGLTDRVTLESHAEADSRVRNGGGGAKLLLGDAGLLSMAAAASDGPRGGGSLLQLGYSWRGYPFSFAVDGTRTFGDYTDVAARYGRAPARSSVRATAGYSFGKASLSASLIQLRYPGEDASRYAGLNFSRSFGPLALNLGASQNLDRARDRNVFVGLSWQFDQRTNVAATAVHERDRNYATLEVSQPIPGDGGFGWRAQVQQGDDVHAGFAEAGWRTGWGQFVAGASSYGGNTLGYASLDGALVFLGGHLFPSRRVDDAFAVVSTDGVAGVPVKLENRPIGVTDRNGMLLVTPLNAWQDNQLAIDPMDLPADRRIERVNAIAAPPRGAGTVVRFGIAPLRAAAVVLVDADGRPLPTGSEVHFDGGSAVVGYDGETYVEGLGDRNTLRVTAAAGACEARFDLPATTQGIPVVGPLTCRKESR